MVDDEEGGENDDDNDESDGNEEATDVESGNESFKTVTNKKVEKKLRQKERKRKEDEDRKKDEERKKKAAEKKSKICGFFIKNSCRHGIKGDKPKGEKKECDYLHPELCRKFINYGKNGCKEGKNCPKFHPKTMLSISEHWKLSNNNEW